MFGIHLNLSNSVLYKKLEVYVFFWSECAIWVTFGKTSNFRLPCFRYVEALEKLEEQLLDVVERFGNSASTGSGLILKPVKTVTKNKYTGQIPLRKSKKIHLTGQVGIVAEKQQLMDDRRTIDVQLKTEETLKISEQGAPLDEDLIFGEHRSLKKRSR